jgi:hypothetical protein
MLFSAIIIVSCIQAPIQQLWRDNSPGERSDLHLFDHLSDDTEFIYASSILVVTKVPTLLAEQIRALL